ncbi:unnamed protein product [Effrenium voratum]|nr:unnamed protein product [Effrenium voratum]
MARLQHVWQAPVDAEEDDDGCRSTAPWPASGAAGLELHTRAWGCSAFLRELLPGAEPRDVAEVGFDKDGRWLCEQLPSGRWQRHDLPGRGSVRLRWEKAAGRWELWAETGGERLVLEATFESSEPQLELYLEDSDYVDFLDVCLLPPPGPGTLQSPPPAHAQLQAQIDQLTAELETEKLQKAEIQQEKEHLRKQLDECKRRYELLTQEKEEETQKVEALKTELQMEELQIGQQLQQSKRRYELLTQEKEEETQKVESAQHEIKALQQKIDSLMEELETEKLQKAEIAQNLQKQLDELARQKAFIHPDTSDSRDEAPGATPVLNNITDSSSLVGDQSDVQSANSFILVSTGDQSDAQSISDASSRSAKCFPPNTVLPGADGHLLRVEKLRIGDRVRLRDLTDAKVARIEAHRKRPHDLVELTTRQGRFTVSKDHRVAVPGPGCQGAQRADQLSEGDLVIVGGKNQKLTKVSHLQECTVLYEVVFEEDQSVQMFHIESYGLVTSGSAVAAESAASASDGPLPALEHIGPGN